MTASPSTSVGVDYLAGEVGSTSRSSTRTTRAIWAASRTRTARSAAPERRRRSRTRTTTARIAKSAYSAKFAGDGLAGRLGGRPSHLHNPVVSGVGRNELNLERGPNDVHLKTERDVSPQWPLASSRRPVPLPKTSTVPAAPRSIRVLSVWAQNYHDKTATAVNYQADRFGRRHRADQGEDRWISPTSNKPLKHEDLAAEQTSCSSRRW